jgi:hypothetical protein
MYSNMPLLWSFGFSARTYKYVVPTALQTGTFVLISFLYHRLLITPVANALTTKISFRQHEDG